MTRLIGHSTLIAAVLASATAVVASLSGRGNRMEAGRRALSVTAMCLGGALVALAWALLTGDYSLEYVARATSRSMSWPYRLGSLWSGMEGSLLLWSWLLAMGTAAGAASLRHVAKAATPADATPSEQGRGAKGPETGRFAPEVGRGGALRGGMQAVCGALVGAASLLVLIVADPFARLAFPALDGAGLTPILEHPALLYHPPILYLGQTLLAVPFAITVAALLHGRLDTGWVAVARRFAVVAWLALTAGMVAGAHWAYQELGWGGFWAWDPVENASLMPWLATTAFLHSALVVERKRRLVAWTAGWALAAFALSLVGAYLTRSGATGSVHAFAEARAIGLAFLGATAAVVTGGGLLLARRKRRLGRGWEPDGVATGEAALLANNAVLLAVLVVVTAGTLAPLVSKALGGNEFLVAPRFFATLTALPALVALALAGIAPALPWSRRSPAAAAAQTAELFRRWKVGARNDQKSVVSRPTLPDGPARSTPRPLPTLAALGGGLGAAVCVAFGLATPVVLVAAAAAGVTVALSVAQAARALRAGRRGRALAAAVAHAGFALALFGIAGSTAGSETSGPIGPGQQLTLGRYRLAHEGVIEQSDERRSSVRVKLGVFVGDDRVGTLRPGLDTYHGTGGSGAPLPEAALRSTPREDLLVTVIRIDTDRGIAVVELFRRPLVAWVWIGGILVVAGGALALRRPGVRRAPAATGRSDRPAVSYRRPGD